MITIHKFILDQNVNRILLPIYAYTLSVGKQDGQVVMWVRLDLEQSKRFERVFHVLGTGQEIPDRPGTLMVFVGTVQLMEHLVMHVFEEMPNSDPDADVDF